MQSLRTSPARAVSRTRQSLTRPSPRRLESSTPALDSHHPTPKTEGFGKGFYIAVASLPVAYIVYNLSHDNNSYLTRVINTYSENKAVRAERNALHTQMVEQAGHDRNLFLNTTGNNYVDLKFPEAINGGSPYNVPAGQGSANLDHLVKFYQDKHFAEEEEKHRLMKEGKLPAQLGNQKGGLRKAVESAEVGEGGGKSA